MVRRLSGARVVTAVVLLTAMPVGSGSMATPGPRETPAMLRSELIAGRYAEVERGARAALADLDKVGQGDSLAAADYLDLLVSSLIQLGNDRGKDARELAEHALSIREKLFPRDDPAATRSMTNLANVLRRQGDPAGAQGLLERALSIRERAFGVESAEYAETLSSLANLLLETGSPAMAKPLFEQVLAIREKALPPADPDIASALVNVGIVRRKLGDAAGAIAAYDRALPIYERAYGPDHIRVANLLNSLAIVQKNSGDWAGATRSWERALPIFEREYPPEHPAVAGVLNNLTDLAVKLGDYAEARRLCERALAIREQALGPDHPEVAQSLGNLAVVLKEQGELARARGLLERALAIREHVLGPTHPDVALTLSNLAEVVGETGDLEGAQADIERALAIREQAFGPDHDVVAESLHNLALVNLARGDLAGARVHAERAVEIWQRTYGELHPRFAQATLSLARVLARQGERDAAIGAALRAEESARGHLRITAAHVSEAEALRYSAVRVTGRDLAITLLVTTQGSADQRRRVWEAVARARGLVLETLLERRARLAEASDPALAALHARLDTAAEELARLLLAGSGRDAPEKTRARLDAAREAEEKAERDLAERSLAFGGGLARQRLSLQEVSAALPAGSALVSFVRYAGETSGTGPAVLIDDRKAARNPRVVALVLRAGAGDVAVVPLGDATAVEERVRAWAERATEGAPRPGESPAQALKAYRDAGRSLRHAVWDPLGPTLRGATLVLVVPDGALHEVSWATLPVGRTNYLVESGPPVHLLTAEREVLILSGAEHHGDGMLAVGGPDYGTVEDSSGASDTSTAVTPDRAQLDRLHFASLPAAGREAAEVAAVWRAATSRAPRSPLASGDAVVLTGTDASEAAFRTLAPGRRVLHAATHAFVFDAPSGDPVAGTRGLGGLAPAGAAAVAEAGEPTPALAALAFAQANRHATATEGRNDGLLTTEEITTLDLSSADWAVLSACDTGLGTLHASEGVLGLERSFRGAGAHTVIMSLWGVSDEATREWMTALYRARFERGMSTAEAVRAAAASLLASRRQRATSHPFAWGAFVATGDWR